MIADLMSLNLECHVTNWIETRYATKMLVGRSIKSHSIRAWLKNMTGLQKGWYTAIVIRNALSNRLKNPVTLLKKPLKLQRYTCCWPSQANVQYM